MYLSRSGAIDAVRASEVFLPFDDAAAVAVLPDFVKAKVAEVGGVDAIKVELEERKPAFVVMKHDEGGLVM